MLNTIYDKVKNDVSFQTAIEALSDDYHTFPCESSEIFEESICEDYATDVGAELHNGISKIVFSFGDYVLKTAFTGYAHWDEDKEEYYTANDIDCDYCEIEYKIYKKAIEANVSDFFAEIIQVSPSVYMQEQYLRSFEDRNYSNKIIDFENAMREKYRDTKGYANWTVALAKDMDCEKLFMKIGSQNFMAFAAYYSKEKLHLLGEFLNYYELNDFHSGNIGWFIDKGIITLKFIDYSGYGTSTYKKLG